MESITAARNISGLEPMSVLHGIAPLCVPMSVSGDFADEVGNRAVPRIVSLWERLGLFYMLEQPQTAPVSNTIVRDIVHQRHSVAHIFKTGTQHKKRSL